MARRRRERMSEGKKNIIAGLIQNTTSRQQKIFKRH